MGLSLETGDKKNLKIVIVEDCEITRTIIKSKLGKLLGDTYSVNFSTFDNLVEAKEFCKNIINNILEGDNYFILLDNDFYGEEKGEEISKDAGLELLASMEAQFKEESENSDCKLNVAFISSDKKIGDKVPEGSNVEIIRGKGESQEYITLIHNWILYILNEENQ